jgi:uncharacterized repeat protein (TIGR03843 family)
MPWSSNATFLATATLGDEQLAVIYKPHRGERPLWDFPRGLYQREVAAYGLSLALGWDLVPETVIRHDAPLGVGSIQRMVDADFAQHYFTLLEDEANHPQLRRMAVFDVVANNADRKGGHCLVDNGGRIWGIDHGLCFHTEPKLRTVIWDFVGTDIEASLREDLLRLASQDLPEQISAQLSPQEAVAVARRAAKLARRGKFPPPQNDHPYPWPLV